MTPPPAPSAARPEFDLLPITSIEIDRAGRQRTELKLDELKLNGLKASIARNGLINPIVVGYREEDDKIWLIAGERRLESCRELGWTFVPVRYLAELSPIERQIIELEENIKRLDLPWQDIVRACGRVHRLYCELKPGWGIMETAEALSLTHSTVSIYMTVFQSLGDERVGMSGTVREAYNLLLKRQSRADGDAVEDLLHATREPSAEGAEEVPASGSEPVWNNLPTTIKEEGFGGQPISPVALLAPTPSILVADFLTWSQTYNGPRFSFIHCDFPYGVELFSSNGIRTGPNRSQMGRDDEGDDYSDTRKTYELLVSALCDSLPRIMSSSGHLMFWLDSRPSTIQWTLDRFAELAPQVTFARFPLIWLKSDNAGIAASPQYEPRHIYEVALLGSTGQRPIIKIKSDGYSCPTDKALHPSCKPEAMLRHFMEMLVDETSSVFDPTCGSGSALRAAEALGAKRVLGLEREEAFATSALRALESARAKRKAAEVLGL